jgi:hypothetical protein
VKKLFFTIILLTVFSIGGFAQTATPGINKTQIKQKRVIHHGIKKGDITKFEARQLRKQQVNIKEEKRLAKADGQISKSERIFIKHEQKMASKNIQRMKHNKRNRA